MAFKQFSLRYKSVMYGAIRSQLKKFHGIYDKHTADDIYQDVLAKLFERSFESFLENEEKQTFLKSFLFTVALNHCKDFIKSKQGRYKQDELSVTGFDEEESLEDLFFVNSESSEELYSLIQHKEILIDEILSQDAQTQKILRLYLKGEMNKDISEQENISVNKVNKIIFNFKTFLEKKYKVAS